MHWRSPFWPVRLHTLLCLLDFYLLVYLYNLLGNPESNKKSISCDGIPGLKLTHELKTNHGNASSRKYLRNRTRVLWYQKYWGSNNQQLECLSNGLLRLTVEETSKFKRIYRWPLDHPYKGTVMLTIDVSFADSLKKLYNKQLSLCLSILKLQR